MKAYDIIKTVRLTEKDPLKVSLINTVVADTRANKFQIRDAVEELFKVKVLRVNTLSVHGKKRRQRTKQAGRSNHWKKAIVKLAKGDKIELV